MYRVMDDGRRSAPDRKGGIMDGLGRVTAQERAEALLYAEALEDPWGEHPTRPDGRLMCGHDPQQHPTDADASRCRDRGW